MMKFVLPLVLLVASSAYASEATVLARLQKNYPQLGKVEQVHASPIPGLYEVVALDHVFYTDEDARYLIDGQIYDLRTMRNLTEERERKLFAVDFDKLPFDLAIKQVKGNGKRRMLVFTDPNCTFCKRLEGELQKVDNVTIYRLLFPIFPGSEEKVRDVWCSKDRNQAWEDMMVRGVTPPPATKPGCSYPVGKAMAWGKKLRVNGTPAMVFSDGMLVPGALPSDEIEKALNGNLPAH
jgi:thiol:disulfide interchange protein DsbC